MSESLKFEAGLSDSDPGHHHPSEDNRGDIPCLVCGDQCDQFNKPNVKQEPVEVVGIEDGGGDGDPLGVGENAGKGRSKWSDEEQNLFHWFSKWFTLKRVQWSFDSEAFPFCTVCKNQLIFLLDLRRKIEELEEALKTGLEEFKTNVSTTEGEFQLSGVYLRDSRYSNVRRQVSGNNIWLRSSFKDISSLLPFVRLSANDKTTADHSKVVTPTSHVGEKSALIQANSEVEASGARNILKATRKRKSGGLQRTSFKKRVKKDDDSDQDYLPPDNDFEADQSDGDLNYNQLDVWREQPCLSDTHQDHLTGKKSQAAEDQKKNLEVTVGSAPIKRKVGRPRKPVVQKDDTDDDFEAEAIKIDSEIHISSRRRSSKGTKKIKIDPQTGIITCLKVQFKPSENDLYSCSICSETVKRNPTYKTNLFRNHVLQTHSNRHACPKCEYRSKSLRSLDYHINTVHKGIKTQSPSRRRHHICSICGEKKHSNRRLESHLWKVHYTEEEKDAALARGEKGPILVKQLRVQCEDCGNLVLQKGMARHKLARHGTPEEQAKAKVLCTVCGRSLYSFDLTSHMKQSHSEAIGLPGHSCDECGKVFKLRRQLTKHLHVHQELAFKCTICGKGFRTNKSFTGHMNLHNNVRPYQCDHCPMSFGSVAVLKKHRKCYHKEGSAPRRGPYVRGLGSKDGNNDGAVLNYPNSETGDSL